MKTNLKTIQTLLLFFFAFAMLTTACKNKSNSSASNDLLEEARKLQKGGTTDETTDTKTTTTPTTITGTTENTGTIPANNMGMVVTASNIWVKTTDKTWQAYTPSGTLVNTYQQSGEDDWTIALKGPAEIALNLHRREAINHTTKKTEKITKSSVKVKGNNATKVITASNIWIKTADKIWEEQTTAGVRVNTYQEKDRDTWSVYLEGPANVQLDLFKKKAINKTTNTTADIVESWFKV